MQDGGKALRRLIDILTISIIHVDTLVTVISLIKELLLERHGHAFNDLDLGKA